LILPINLRVVFNFVLIVSTASVEAVGATSLEFTVFNSWFTCSVALDKLVKLSSEFFVSISNAGTAIFPEK